MAAPAWKVSLIVEVRPVGTAGVIGLSVSGSLVGEDYDEEQLASRAVRQFREARAEAQRKLREKRAIDASQSLLFR